MSKKIDLTGLAHVYSKIMAVISSNHYTKAEIDAKLAQMTASIAEAAAVSEEEAALIDDVTNLSSEANQSSEEILGE